MKKNDIDKLTLYTIYKNYLYSLQAREEFKDKYGDTEEIIKMYENQLQKYGVKKLTKKNKE